MHKPLLFLLLPVLAISLLSAACTYKPVHPNKTDREWTSDNEDCQQSVREALRDEPDTYDNFDEMRLINQCMKAKGWQWERTNLINLDNTPAK
jgi:hypothetical protein